MTRDLEGLRLLVTGGASGLGLACATRLVEKGVHVVIVDLNREAGAAVAARLGVTYMHADVCNTEQINAALERNGFDANSKKDYDRVLQTTAAHDTLMALNYRFGRGHTEAYFKRPGMSEAEFLAHAFENYFKGNPVFEQFMPELYAETKALIADFLIRFDRTRVR